MKSTIVRFAAPLALAALGVAACGGAPDGTQAAPQTERTVTVDAASVAAVPTGQSYVVDIGRADTSYLFEYAAAPIDFSRVTIRFASGFDMPMSAWLAQTATDGRDIVAQNPGHFELTPAQSDDPGVHVDTLTEAHCVQFCANVCQSATGPCRYVCISTC